MDLPIDLHSPVVEHILEATVARQKWTRNELDPTLVHAHHAHHSRAVSGAADDRVIEDMGQSVAEGDTDSMDVVLDVDADSSAVLDVTGAAAAGGGLRSVTTAQMVSQPSGQASQGTQGTQGMGARVPSVPYALASDPTEPSPQQQRRPLIQMNTYVVDRAAARTQATTNANVSPTSPKASASASPASSEPKPLEDYANVTVVRSTPPAPAASCDSTRAGSSGEREVSPPRVGLLLRPTSRGSAGAAPAVAVALEAGQQLPAHEEEYATVDTPLLEGAAGDSPV